MNSEEEKFNPICQACGSGCFDWGDIDSDPQAYIAGVRKEARADALREAAGIAGAHCIVNCKSHHDDAVDATAYSIREDILNAIDQPQEDVCECNADPSHRIGFKFCPYCGKPIKVKE